MMAEFPLLDSDQLNEYLSAHTSDLDPLLDTLDRETHLRCVNARMLSGKLQARFLQLLCQLHQPQSLLEIGTFTGYSALAVAAVMPPTAILDTLEINPELEPLIRKYLAQAPQRDRIRLHICDANDWLNLQSNHWDWVFLDADKRQYPHYLDLLTPRMNRGGLLICDNVLWNGKVLDPHINDADTQALRTFNDLINKHPSWETCMLPMRDGLLVARRRD